MANFNTQKSIAINWVYGAPDTGCVEDEARAQDAALNVFTNAGVIPGAAQAEYMEQWKIFDDEAPMTGLARTWIEATEAANTALTSAWTKPCNASRSIEAW